MWRCCGETTSRMNARSCVHRKEDAPFNMEDNQGDPTYRIIPRDVSYEALCITHDYYDHRDADKDLNIVFPLDRLQELAREHLIGEVAPFHYSFMGHIDGPQCASPADGHRAICGSATHT